MRGLYMRLCSWSQINVPEVLHHTLRGENFNLFDSGADDPNRFFIFGTLKNLDMLTENTNWFADGTFKIAPKLFYQLTTIHVLVKNTVLPMLYIFLQRKDEETYKLALHQLCNMKDNLRPSSIM